MSSLNYASFFEVIMSGVKEKNEEDMALALLGCIYHTVPVYKRKVKKDEKPQLYSETGIDRGTLSLYKNQKAGIPQKLVEAAGDARVEKKAPQYFLEEVVDRLDNDLRWDMLESLHKLIENADNIRPETRTRFNRLAERLDTPEKIANYLAQVFLYAIKMDNTKSEGTGLYYTLLKRFSAQYTDHPSIKLMKPDPRLFPKGLPTINSYGRTAKEGDIEPSTVQEMVLKSWQDPKEKKHILLVGEGGIGKTVCMLTLPTEEWFCKYEIPVIYIPLQSLDAYQGNLNNYIGIHYKNEIDEINSVAASLWEGHPNLIILLDGFNEIPMEYRATTEKHIRAWMDKPGVQVITTSRINVFLNNRFREYNLQTLPYESCRDYLLSSGISDDNLPAENDAIWKVINVPLMLTMFTQIDKVMEKTNDHPVSDYLVWKKPDNAAHIIWDYMQLELFRLIETEGAGVVLQAAAILAVAPYVCFDMSKNGQFYVKQKEFQKLLQKATNFFAKNHEMIPEQVKKLQEGFYRERVKPFEENRWEDYFDILTCKSVLFQEKRNTDVTGNLEIIYVPAHQNFRDALAAVFVSGCMLNNTREGKKPDFSENILDNADFYVFSFISELLSDDELQEIWDYHRITEPANGNTTLLLMDLLGRKRNYDFRELNFSGLDLAQINLYPLISRRQDICSLPQKASFFKKTKITRNSLTLWNSLTMEKIIFSKNRNKLLTIYSEGDVITWNLPSGTFDIKHKKSYAHKISVCGQKGQLIATAVKNYRALFVDLHDIVTHDNSSISLKHPLKIEQMIISPDDRFLAVYGKDSFEKGRLEILNLQNGTTLMDSIYTIKYMSFDYDGRFLGCVILNENSMDEIVFFDIDRKNSTISISHSKHANDTINSPMTFNRDLRYLAFSDLLGTSIRIWDFKHESLEILEVDNSNSQYHITSMAFSPDGRYLACALRGNKKRTIQVWDWRKGTFKILEDGQYRPITCVAFSPDGNSLVSSSDHGGLKIWNWEKGLFRELTVSKKIYYSISSMDDKYVAGISSNNEVFVWNLENKTRLVLGNITDEVTGLVISPDSKYLACISYKYDAVQIWNLQNNNLLQINYFPNEWNKGLSLGHNDEYIFYSNWTFSPCSRWLIANSNDGIICVWDLKKQVFKVLDCGIKWPDLRFIDERFIASNYVPRGDKVPQILKKGVLQIWNLESGTCYMLRIDGKPYLQSITISPMGNYLAFAVDEFPETVVWVWDWKSGTTFQLKVISDYHKDNVTSLVFSPKENYLACLSKNGKICIWNWKNGTHELTDTYAHRIFGVISRVVFHPSEDYLVCIDEHTVCIWDWKNKTFDRLWWGQFGRLYDDELFRLSSDGKRWIVCSDEGVIIDSDVENNSRNVLISFSKKVYNVTFSQDSRYIAGVLEDGKVQVLDLIERASKILDYDYEPNPFNKIPNISFTAKGRHLRIKYLPEDEFTFNLETGNLLNRNTLKEGIVLYGANFEQAIIPDHEKVWFKSAGAKV